MFSADTEDFRHSYTLLILELSYFPSGHSAFSFMYLSPAN